MSIKKTFKIKLDAEFEVNFSNWDFSDDEKTKEDYFKKVILEFYFERNGLDEVEISEITETSLFETMSEMFNPNKK